MESMKTSFMTTKELAKACGYSRQRIPQMIREGKIKPDINADNGTIFLFSLKNAQKIMAKYSKKVKESIV